MFQMFQQKSRDDTPLRDQCLLDASVKVRSSGRWMAVNDHAYFKTLACRVCVYVDATERRLCRLRSVCSWLLKEQQEEEAQEEMRRCLF